MKKYAPLLLAALIIACCASFSTAAAKSKPASPEPTSKTIPRENKIGKKVSAQLEKEIPRVLDPSQEAKLAVIASKLTPYLQRDLNYNVRIIEMKEPNAFSLPGGQTYITTGMLNFLKSDAEIAAVLAHEFVHADRAHGIVQAARNNRLSLLTIAGIIAATQGAPEAMIMAQAVQTAAINRYSIELEKEADERGIDVLRKAGYNPAAMLTMMERLRVEHLKHDAVDPGIYQTHPDEQERVKAALKYMKDNGIEVQRKDVVQMLNLDVVKASGDVRLTVDGAALFSLRETPEAVNFLTEMEKRLDESLELELAPYDIQTAELDGGEVLMIKGKVLVRSSELPEGMPSIAEIRKRINETILNARRGNRLTDYFQ